MTPIELLAPAANKHIAKQAILHGADAVYVGGPSHGARKNAANSVQDISEIVDFAHQFRARVYVTVNTLVYEQELHEVETLCQDLYRIGVDALIVQDMSLLRLDIPPIALHASTQCDTRTLEKAKFLQDVGFSQIVLARELSLKEIKNICQAVSVPVECFVHGALCVSYSGRCAASLMTLNRSANRGECAQLCRLPYTLRNGKGEVLEKDRYLLSLRDFNLSNQIEDLMLAGVRSFKIEGRLKDDSYVRNVTAAYRNTIDKVIDRYPEQFRRSSYGVSEINFEPDLYKSFNRGFTDYFINGRCKTSMASLKTPKSMGEVIKDINSLHPGDGISFFNKHGEYEGVGVNGIKNGRIMGYRPFVLPKNAIIHRTFDRHWENLMSGNTASRKIKLDVSIDDSGVTANDERGVTIRLPLEVLKFEARKPMNPRPIFEKLGDTIYRLNNFINSLDSSTFIPASKLTGLRRKLCETLDKANILTYKFDYRRPEQKVDYFTKSLDPRDNVANSLSKKFYEDHGVNDIRHAYEINKANGSTEVMTTRYCLRRELGCCLKDKTLSQKIKSRFISPLYISSGNLNFKLDFDCKNCEMKVNKI